MISRDKLLAVMQTRYDFYSARAMKASVSSHTYAPSASGFSTIRSQILPNAFHSTSRGGTVGMGMARQSRPQATPTIHARPITVAKTTLSM